MARPKPKVLLEFVDKEYKCEQILYADAVYAVCYDGMPINIRTMHKLKILPVKYKKCNFSNPGHAQSLALRLNKKFHTDKFKVQKLVALVTE